MDLVAVHRESFCKSYTYRVEPGDDLDLVLADCPDWNVGEYLVDTVLDDGLWYLMGRMNY